MSYEVGGHLCPMKLGGHPCPMKLGGGGEVGGIHVL